MGETKESKVGGTPSAEAVEKLAHELAELEGFREIASHILTHYALRSEVEGLVEVARISYMSAPPSVCEDDEWVLVKKEKLDKLDDALALWDKKESK